MPFSFFFYVVQKLNVELCSKFKSFALRRPIRGLVGSNDMSNELANNMLFYEYLEFLIFMAK